MNIIKPNVQIMTPIDGDFILKHLEACGRTCYVEGTEILTDRGFVTVETIAPEDRVLTYNQDKNLLEYQPSNMVIKDYDGEIVKCEHANIKFAVTPEHRMLVSGTADRDYYFIKAKELFGYNRPKKRTQVNFRIPKFFCNAFIQNTDFKEPQTVTKFIKHGARPATEEKLNICINDDWLILLAAYIAEGCTKHGEGKGHGSSIQISQTEDTELYNSVISALENLSINYHICSDPRKKYVKTIVFGNQLYVELFETLCGRYSKNKHLPPWFRRLSKEQLELMLKVLYWGDGSHSTTRHEKYLSISNRLLNEVQEAFILIGKNATVNYDINISQKCYTEENLRDSWIIKQQHLATTNYCGKVYCPSTDNGIVCVRYQGKTFWCGNCYKSEDKTTDTSAEKFLTNILKRGHEAVIEHYAITVRFTCDRGVTHEIVRHRLASYSQESTRYCNYSQDKFDNNVTYIDLEGGMELDPACSKMDADTISAILAEWWGACADAERHYFKMLELGAPPQIARSVLNNSTKTELVMTANIREWRHFFNLRCDRAAHPQMREVAIMLLNQFKEQIPILFDDIEVEE